MQQQLILVRKAGQKVPTEVRTKILENYKSTYGYAVLNGDEFEIDQSPNAQTLEVLQSIEEEQLDNDMVEFYGNSAAGFPDDDAQPYTILEDADGKPLIACCVAGDCPSFAKKDSAFSPAYFAAIEYIAAKFEEVFALDSVDTLEDIFLEFEKGMKKEELLTMVSGGAPVVITFYDMDGTIRTFSKGAEFSKEFPWGFISDASVFEGKPSAISKVVKKGTALVKNIAGGGAKPEPVTVLVPNPPKTDTAIPPTAGVMKYTSITIEYPDGLKSANKNSKGDWCLAWLGFKPEGYKSQKMFIITDPEAIKKYIAKGGVMKSFQADTGNLEVKGPVEGVNKTDASPKALNKPEEVDPIIAGAVIKSPVRDAIRESKEKGQIKFALDHHSQRLAKEPSKIQEVESKIAAFSEQIGYDHDELVRWPRAAWREIGNKHGYLPLVEALLESNRRIEHLEELLTSPTAAEDGEVGAIPPVVEAPSSEKKGSKLKKNKAA